MIIVNQSYSSANIYAISIGEGYFVVYADSEDEAVELIAEYLVSRGKSDWYFDATSAKFVKAEDLRYCPKHNVYLPKLKIQEVVL